MGRSMRFAPSVICLCFARNGWSPTTREERDGRTSIDVRSVQCPASPIRDIGRYLSAIDSENPPALPNEKYPMRYVRGSAFKGPRT